MLEQQYPSAVTPSNFLMALLAHLLLNHPETAAELLSQHMQLAQSWTDAEQQQVHQAALDLLKSHPTTAAAACGSTICKHAIARKSSNAAVQHSQLMETCLAAGMLEFAVEVRQSMKYTVQTKHVGCHWIPFHRSILQSAQQMRQRYALYTAVPVALIWMRSVC